MILYAMILVSFVLIVCKNFKMSKNSSEAGKGFLSNFSHMNKRYIDIGVVLLESAIWRIFGNRAMKFEKQIS